MGKVLQNNRPWNVEYTRKSKFKKMCRENGFAHLSEDCPLGGIKALCSQFKRCKECKRYWNGVEE